MTRNLDLRNLDLAEFQDHRRSICIRARRWIWGFPIGKNLDTHIIFLDGYVEFKETFMAKTYVVYVHLGSLSNKKAKKHIKKVSKVFKEQAKKKERWFFVGIREGNSRIEKLI